MSSNRMYNHCMSESVNDNCPVFMDTDPAKENQISLASFNNSIRLNRLPEVAQGWMTDIGQPIRKMQFPMDRMFLKVINTERLSRRSRAVGYFIRGSAAGAAAGAGYTLYTLLY